MTAVFARKVLLADGWTDNVRLDLDGGRIARITRRRGRLRYG